MNKAIIILFLSISNLIVSQDFAPLNAKWYYQKHCANPPWMSNCGYFTAEIVRDTIINSQSAKIMEYTNLGNIIPNAQIIIAEDSNKVYFYESNTFKLLYDFNLNTGDTLTYSIPYNWFNYDFTCGGNTPDTSKFSQAIIDSTKQLTISSQSLKSLYTSSITSNDTSKYYSWQLGQIIERIGSLRGLFGHSVTQCLSGYPGNLRCYNDSLINYKPDTLNCDFVTEVEKLRNKKNAIIYPNPTSTHFTIEGLNEPFKLSIYNAVGQLLYQEQISEHRKQMDVSQFAKGILFIKIEAEGEVIYQKVVRQ